MRWIIAVVVMVLMVGAGWAEALHYRATHWQQDAARLEATWSKEAGAGVPAAWLAPLRDRLQHLMDAKVGPIPALDWPGTHDGSALQALNLSTAHLWTNAMAKARVQNQQALMALVKAEGSFATASAVGRQRLLNRATTPNDLLALSSQWMATAHTWSQDRAALAKMGGRSVHGIPEQLQAGLSHLRDVAEQAHSQGLSVAVADQAEEEVAAFAKEPPAQQLSGYRSTAAAVADAAQHLQSLMAQLAAQVAASSPVATAPPSLAASLQQFLSTRTSVVSVAVYNANNGTTFALNPNLTFDTASIIKVAIMSTLLRQSQLNHQPLTSAEANLMVPMIEDSSNSAATTLWWDAGGATGISAYTRSLGMSQTVPDPYGYWGLSGTSAPDQVTLMRQIAYPGGALTNANRAYALNLMEHVIGWEDWGISGGVPSGVTVALKNGWLPLPTLGIGWAVNSVGYVNGQGRNYVIAVLTRDNATEQYGIATIQGVSSLVWQALGS